MTLFETLLGLLLAAIMLTQVTRRLSIPYPSALAAAGLAVAFVPGSPNIKLDPGMALAVFIAPALVDAAFDFPLSALRRLWRPLALLVVGAVIATTGTVAAIGWAFAGLPLAAAVTLGAIVAPPDAAAASAILAGAALPRRTVEVLKGESLLNDSTTLLIFAAATAIQAHGGLDTGVALGLGLAAPGGLLLGIVLARLYRWLVPFVSGSLGGNLLEFVATFWIWIIAERLHLSAVLAVVAYAMTVARSGTIIQRPDVRVHSFAVWGSVVFLLNVLAFLLMGMQVRTILGEMSHARLVEASGIAAIIVATVIATRIVTVLIYHWLNVHVAAVRGGDEVPTVRQALLVGWCGMRGLVTLATAFALPADFPQRDLITLTAFAVVIGTLVVQGLTLNPVIKLLRLGSSDEHDHELAAARRSLADTAVAALADKHGEAADHLRHRFELERGATRDDAASNRLDGWLSLQQQALRAQRARLIDLRDDTSIGEAAFAVLQQELDFKELSIRPGDETSLDEG